MTVRHYAWDDSMSRWGDPLRNLRELAQYFHLVLSFARRDIRARYKQTALGAAWAILQPASLMAVFTLVFSRLARVPSDGVPYPIFSYGALVFWSFFATALSQGTLAMTANGTLVRKIYFPRETLLLGTLLSTAFDLAISFTLLLGLFVYYRMALSWMALWVFPLLVLQVLFTLVVICITSSVHVYFRDMAHVLPLALQLWMFATPVAYPMTVVPDGLRPLYALNPMVPIIEGYRAALLHQQAPDLGRLGIWFGVVIVLACGSYVFFKRVERTFADVI
jgi:homopolymeric O-antigen transport system permease protein